MTFSAQFDVPQIAPCREPQPMALAKPVSRWPFPLVSVSNTEPQYACRLRLLEVVRVFFCFFPCRKSSIGRIYGQALKYFQK